MTFIGVHEMHGRVHSNLCHVTDLLVVDLSHHWPTQSMMTQISNKKIASVARQLPRSTHTHTHTHTNNVSKLSGNCLKVLLYHFPI